MVVAGPPARSRLFVARTMNIEMDTCASDAVGDKTKTQSEGAFGSVELSYLLLRPTPPLCPFQIPGVFLLLAVLTLFERLAMLDHRGQSAVLRAIDKKSARL